MLSSETLNLSLVKMRTQAVGTAPRQMSETGVFLFFYTLVTLLATRILMVMKLFASYPPDRAVHLADISSDPYAILQCLPAFMMVMIMLVEGQNEVQADISQDTRATAEW
ncbi:hypothetical protein EDD22DRAFT_634903 [Suillus occidentalis]|nr:hypothetical protein EDD22DRAFT_634903 [Suillus occidentalis]